MTMTKMIIYIKTALDTATTTTISIIPTKNLAWNSPDCFESLSPLNNVWIDRPLMPSSDVTHYPKTG